MKEDIRWKQRFNSFEKAMDQLESGIETHVKNVDNIDSIIKEGIIQRFEFTHELAWKVLKDYLEYEGIQDIVGARSTTKVAFNKGLIDQGQVWMNMIDTRNNTVHTYQLAILETEFRNIVEHYYPILIMFRNNMKKRIKEL